MLKAKSATVAALALMGVFATGAARADVVYTFNTTSYAYLGNTDNPDYRKGLPLNAEITLPSATVASGHFDLSGRFDTPDYERAYPNSPIFQVESGAFDSLNFQGVTATPTSLFGAIDLHLTFDGYGNIASSNFSGYSYSDEFNGSGPGYNVTGYLGSDDPRCNAGAISKVCVYSGYFSETGFTPTPPPVPEPATFAMLGAGLIGLAATRRRRA